MEDWTRSFAACGHSPGCDGGGPLSWTLSRFLGPSIQACSRLAADAFGGECWERRAVEGADAPNLFN